MSRLLRLHVTPIFGQRRVSEITRDDVKEFLASISSRAHFSRNTVRLILSALRAVLSAAQEDKLIESNPASKVGRFNKKEKGKAKAQAMSRTEAERFLEAVEDLCPDYYPLFFTALRAGLRKGELIALQWGDVQFGESEADKNRFILLTDVALQQVYKFSHDGRLLMTLGERGVRAMMPRTSTRVTDVAVAPDGSFFVTMAIAIAA